MSLPQTLWGWPAGEQVTVMVCGPLSMSELALACQVVGVPAAAGGAEELAGVVFVSPPAVFAALFSFFNIAQPALPITIALIKSASKTLIM